jgi:hypothetical protein
VKKLIPVIAGLVLIVSTILGGIALLATKEEVQEARAEADKGKREAFQLIQYRAAVLEGKDITETIERKSAWASSYRAKERAGIATEAETDRRKNLEKQLERDYRAQERNLERQELLEPYAMEE